MTAGQPLPAPSTLVIVTDPMAATPVTSFHQQAGCARLLFGRIGNSGFSAKFIRRE
jgi:hypothetical protein